ncbi:ATP-dependent DNA helicase DinG [Neobacillus terrae]|uniref:ATP-dependent DNA helicase DinG n=1 Tax=Neobacillus terrae TaxID=3034837 RepID=UPI00140CF6F9|nr:ATP-dependent DNA helicase DinG [Neobacillus terrae]NHM29153.1 ATP-dependent DNA helicase DinG [Neobacillus terrae]
MLNKFVVIDLETTGNAPKKGDRIIQFAAVVIENGTITNQFSSFVNPNVDIPAFIEELTGINSDMVKDAPSFSEIAPKVMELLEDAYFVAHNVLFDLSFLQEELVSAGHEGFYGPILDTVELARILYPTADGYKLTDLADQHDLMHDRPHQADSDALVTAELFLILMEKLNQLPVHTLYQLSMLAGGLKSDLEQLMEEMLDEKNRQSNILPGNIEIFNGIAIRKQVITEKPLEGLFFFPETNEEKTVILEKSIPDFELKLGQYSMMDKVYEAFNGNTHTLIEAGTGVGKSLGYLLPAAYFSRLTNNRVVVSTHTIQLQEQLLAKEIPQLQKILPFRIKAVLLKGRSHYISLEKFAQSLREENDNYDTTLSKMQILVWLTETGTGDKDELNLSSGGMIYWSRIKGDETVFLNSRKWMEMDFYLRAKEAAIGADIIITNHAMLLADLSARNSVLPEYEYVVIDEGHQFEKAAAKFMGCTLDYLNTRLLLSHLGLYEQRQLFYRMEKLLNGETFLSGEILHTFEVNQLIADSIYEMDEFFKIAALAAKKGKRGSSNRIKVRFEFSNKGKEWLALVSSGERFVFLVKDLISSIQARVDWILENRPDLTIEQQGYMEQLHSLMLDLEKLKANIQELILNNSGLVKWIETDIRSPQNTTAISAQPVSVADSLERSFFAVKKAVVVTSATLTVNQAFDYIIDLLGLKGIPSSSVQIPSPFKYESQVQLLITDDLPEINSVPADEYVAAITEHIISIAEATRGRMLILFTSQDMLKKTYELIKESGFLDEFAIIAQGITSGSRSRLTRNFKKFDKAILLGTSSFWEGVDIPGEDLTCLVIVRLPFSSPDDPLTEAKCDVIKQKGGNPFSEYSLPEAILRFKQGFGRLIRTEQDRGVIVVFDKRIVTARYGRDFLKSIPPIKVKKGNIDELIERIHSWL